MIVFKRFFILTKVFNCGFIRMAIKDSPSEKLLTPKEVSEILGITKDTLSVWRCTGRYNLPYVKVGRYVRYRNQDVEDFIRRRTVAA